MSDGRQDFWDCWRSKYALEEEELRGYSMAVVAEAQKCSWDDDLEGIRDLIALYDEGSKYCRREPLTTPYEHAWILIHVTLASALTGAGEHRQAHLEVERCIDLLAAQGRRRERLDLPPRFNSEVRLMALYVLADCKIWEPSLRERSPRPPKMFEEFLMVTERLASVLPRIENEEYVANSRRHWLHATMAMARVALFADRSWLTPLFNLLWEQHGIRLAQEERDFLSLPPGTEMPPEYWEFELHKLSVSGNLQPADLDLCTKGALEAIHRSDSAIPLEARVHTWEVSERRLRGRYRSSGLTLLGPA